VFRSSATADRTKGKAMRQAEVVLAKPSKAQKAQAFREATAHAVANRAKGGALVRISDGTRTHEVPRITAVRFAVILANLTGEAVEVTDLFIVTGDEYSADRSALYHLTHRATGAVESAHGARIKVTAFLAGTVTRKGRTLAGITSTKGECEAVVISLA
jgi:hypothetical protein